MLREVRGPGMLLTTVNMRGAAQANLGSPISTKDERQGSFEQIHQRFRVGCVSF